MKKTILTLLVFVIFFSIFGYSNTRNVPADYTTIQAAINAVQNSDTILVASGTYTGAGNRNISLLGKSLVIKSQNGAVATIIDCEFQDRTFLINQGESSSLVIEGFSIRNGNPSNAPLDYGAAIFVAGNSGMTLRSCIIENCTKMAIQFGNQEVAGPGSFISNTIFRNNINGCILSWKKSLIADSCLFENNSGTAFCVVQNYHASNSIGEYRNCVFRNNNAVMTVFLAHGWTAENCLIYNNSASYGTFFLAINFSGTNNSVNHCTVVNNISSSSTNPNAYDNASGIKN